MGNGCVDGMGEPGASAGSRVNGTWRCNVQRVFLAAVVLLACSSTRAVEPPTPLLPVPTP